MPHWEEALKSLRSEYVREARERLEGIEKVLERLAAEPGDRGALHDLMRGFHGFAGSGATYGFPEVSALGQQAERSCFALLKDAAAAAPADLDRWRRLTALVESELGREGGAASSKCEAGRPAASPRGDILLVDDDEALVRLLSHLIEQEGLSVRHAATMADALRALDERMPSGCIVDIRLPDGSGYDFVKRFRAEPAGEGPVLILSMLTGFLDKVEAIHCGADGYFEKPVDWDVLMRRLLHLL
ncbi:MAG TPA: response regulator, partial [Vicinamibacteria bacterium]|nr:response regulator [Vicinamibacteria bacterium]